LFLVLMGAFCALLACVALARRAAVRVLAAAPRTVNPFGPHPARRALNTPMQRSPHCR
jgi:hypothetical protein